MKKKMLWIPGYETADLYCIRLRNNQAPEHRHAGHSNMNMHINAGLTKRNGGNSQQ